jgi:hypothetical protein
MVSKWALVAALCVLILAVSAYAYKVKEYEDEFEGVTVNELIDNKLTGMFDKTEVYLNLQNTAGTDPPGVKFVVVYISPNKEFEVAEGEALFFLVGEKKYALTRCEACTEVTNKAVNDRVKTLKGSEGLAKAMTGDKSKKSEFVSTFAYFAVTPEDIAEIVSAEKGKIKIVGLEGASVVKEVKKGHFEDLKRFYDEYVVASSQ